MLDMPGVLWKKFESYKTASNLAFIGSIKDDILDIEEIAVGLLEEMQHVDPQKLAERYRLSEEDLMLEPYDLLEVIGKKRGMLMSGGAVNTERAAIMPVSYTHLSVTGRSLKKFLKPPVRVCRYI